MPAGILFEFALKILLMQLTAFIPKLYYTNPGIISVYGIRLNH
ncbi:hypothetical protein X792_01485 [Dehalococcoides mccartyi CG1]|nr:hypothetical protein GY50_0231 [Dehalococcoides mccartyi GY50]AII58681.1 hypothetical protein X792_01485 [Dehalococcoides mccartyi CG1]